MFKKRTLPECNVHMFIYFWPCNLDVLVILSWGKEKGWLFWGGRLILKGKERWHKRLKEQEGEAALLRDGWRLIKVFVIAGEMSRGEQDEQKDERARDGVKRRGDVKRDGEGFRGHNNDKMTRGWSKHGSCLPTGEGEWERRWRDWRRRGDSRLKGHSVYGEKKRLRDIDVWREERDEERQLGMESWPLALKREKDDEAKEGQRWWEPERGTTNTERGKEGRKRRIVEGKSEREAEIQWEYSLHCTQAVLWSFGVRSAANVLFLNPDEGVYGDWKKRQNDQGFICVGTQGKGEKEAQGNRWVHC